jgi:hypothetical protein
MKYVEERPYAKPEAAGKRLLEIASTVDASDKGRIFVEKVNGPFLFEDKASPAEYGAGMKWLQEQGLILMDPRGSGCFFTFTDKGAQEFA